MRAAVFRTHELSLVYGIENHAGQVERGQPLLQWSCVAAQRGQLGIEGRVARHGSRR